MTFEQLTRSLLRAVEFLDAANASRDHRAATVNDIDFSEAMIGNPAFFIPRVTSDGKHITSDWLLDGAQYRACLSASFFGGFTYLGFRCFSSESQRRNTITVNTDSRKLLLLFNSRTPLTQQGALA